MSISFGHHRTSPVRHILGLRLLLCHLLVLIIGLRGGAGAADGEDGAAPVAEAFERLVAKLQEQYPDRDSVQQSYRDVEALLGEFIQANPASKKLAEARALCAEVLLLGGDRVGAVKHWTLMSVNSEDPEGQARGLYLLAADCFLRDETDKAQRHFSRLTGVFPRSAWATRSKSSMRYLAIQTSRSMPAFEVTVKRGGKKAKLNPTNLAGKVTLVHFWRSDTANHGAFIETLGRNPDSSLEQAFKEYPVLRGKVVIFGVNLDTERKIFEAARDRWKIPWPQVHDGKGFETPLARTLGIPRSPHWLVLGPAGRVWYLGADLDKFYAYASEALKRHRIALEKKKKK